MSTSNYAHFDYYESGKFRMKNSFPKDITDDKTPLVLNMRRYDDCGEIIGYHKIFKLIIKSIKNNNINTNFKEYIKVDTSNAQDKFTDLTLIIQSNNEIAEKLLTNEQKERITRGQCCFNHRLHNLHVWKYQMEPFYLSYILPFINNENNRNKLELCYAFTNEYNSLSFNNRVKIQDVSVVNMVIYGKTKIKQI